MDVATLTDTERRPHYETPPVIEVVCGVQFEGINGWGTPHFGKFWGRIEEEYSTFEDQPPLPPLRLDQRPVSEPQVSLLPPVRRVFYIKPPGNFLMQLQQNRFLHNWRKMRDDDAYPRFDVAFERFRRYWEVFKEFVQEAGLTAPLPEAFELTYVNHIMAEGAAFPRDVWEYLDFYQKTPEATTAREASSLTIHFEWPLPSEAGVLTLDVKHGFRLQDQKDVLLMELNARGRAVDGDSSVEQWFDGAHIAIINTFDKLTTKKAHKMWRKTE